MSASALRLRAVVLLALSALLLAALTVVMARGVHDDAVMAAIFAAAGGLITWALACIIDAARIERRR